MLEFDEKEHVYRWDGKVVPSSTQVIGEWQKVNVYGNDYYVNNFTGTVVRSETFERAADFGRAIHKAALYMLSVGVNWDALASELVNPLKQFEKWLVDYKVRPVQVEKPQYSKRYKYAGTSDIICLVKGDKLIVCDIKTGEYDLAGPQLASYEVLYRENSGWKGKMGRCVLHLPKGGSPYVFEPFRDRLRDWSFFQSRLYQHNYLNAA